MNKRQTGTRWEDEAARFLTQCGLRIKELNFRSRFGEIDIIAKDDEFFVFVEVKYRKNTRKGMPFEAVNTAKQARIYRTAQWYIKEHHLSSERKYRFDVLSVLDGKITHIRNAFGGF